MFLQLSPLMQQAISNWRRLGHLTDDTLISQCAYYPRSGCQHCSFQSPNPSCNHSHILTLSEPQIKSNRNFFSFHYSTGPTGSAEGGAYPTTHTKLKRRNSLERIWSQLPLNIQELIKKELREVEGGQL